MCVCVCVCVCVRARVIQKVFEINYLNPLAIIIEFDYINRYENMPKIPGVREHLYIKVKIYFKICFAFDMIIIRCKDYNNYH